MKKQQWIVSASLFVFAPIACLTVSYKAFGEGQDTPTSLEWSDSVIETEEEGASILIIPMSGQMHTDIQHDVYESLVDRIIEVNPDLILIEMESVDWKNNFHQLMGWGDRQEFSGYDKNDLVDLAAVFHVKLKKLPQVIWVKNASGTSTVLALSWPTMYMSYDGSLHATMGVSRMFDYIKAEDTHGKIREAAVAHSKAFALYGKRSPALLRAFVDPEVPLSGTWKGKEVFWEESINGDFVLDPGEGMPHLTATVASEVGISKGSVFKRNDVLLAQGIREYHIVGKDITKEITAHIEDWRSDFERAGKAWLDAVQFETWAVGEETERYLRDRLRSLKQVLRLMENSSGLAMRMGWKYRIDKKLVNQLIDRVEEQLRQLRDNQEKPRGGGGGGRPIGGGGGR